MQRRSQCCSIAAQPSKGLKRGCCHVVELLTDSGLVRGCHIVIVSSKGERKAWGGIVIKMGAMDKRQLTTDSKMEVMERRELTIHSRETAPSDRPLGMMNRDGTEKRTMLDSIVD
jgi:hypothetical protein